MELRKIGCFILFDLETTNLVHGGVERQAGNNLQDLHEKRAKQDFVVSFYNEINSFSTILFLSRTKLESQNYPVLLLMKNSSKLAKN